MLDELTDSLMFIGTQTRNNADMLMIILSIPWLVFFFSLLISDRILLLGIIPRHLRGLPGILFAPLLHTNFNHLFFNSIPLLVLSNFILLHGLAYYLQVTLLITLISGFTIWCLAPPGLYVGASALVTGYWGLLVCNLYQSGTMTSIILGLISVYYFAGIFLGIFPNAKGASWQGHLFGLLAGVATNYLVNLR